MGVRWGVLGVSGLGGKSLGVKMGLRVGLYGVQ